MRFLALIFSVLLLSGILTGCGMEVHEEPEPTPEPTKEPVIVYTAEASALDLTLGQIEVICPADGGFYAATVEKTGENIPDNVAREAVRRGREPYNDGRYDLLGTKLWHIAEDGSVTPLEGYLPLEEEENTGGWKGFACETGLDTLALGKKDGQLLTLEYNAFSGNSAPALRQNMIPGKDYREYHVNWFLRTLDETGRELSREAAGTSREAATELLHLSASAGAGQTEPDEVPFSWDAIGWAEEDLISPVLPLKDGAFRFLAKRDGETFVVTVSTREQEEEECVLLLVSDSLTPALRDAVSAFNRENENCSVSVISYEEVSAGAAPDLFCVTPAAARTMAEVRMLADLYPFLDADKDLKRSDFFANILKALEVDGMLPCTCAGVSFQTVIGASELVGEDAGWTYDEFLQAWSDLGIGTDAFDAYTTCRDVLNICLSMDMDTFLDRGRNTCSFTGEPFRKLLYFTGNFPRGYDYSSHTITEADHSDLRVRRGKQMLLEKELCNFKDALICGCEYPGEITFIGYPTLSGTGNMMTISTLDTGINLAMSAACTHKEEAWQFLRTFFSEEYQQQYWYFPTNINVFNRKLNDAMAAETLRDKQGNVMTDRTTGKPLIRSVDTMYLSNFTEVNIYPLTEAKAEHLVDLVRSTTKLRADNGDICTIVESSVAPFYSGEQTLEEAAAAAQEAVSMYLASFAQFAEPPA